jgi:hypothetical protein
LEVKCKSSGETRRFAVGTDAGFALSLINRRLESGKPLALHIEALKEGEEPIAFGPNSALVDYGHGWNLQTVIELDFVYAGNWVLWVSHNFIYFLVILNVFDTVFRGSKRERGPASDDQIFYSYGNSFFLFLFSSFNYLFGLNRWVVNLIKEVLA